MSLYAGICIRQGLSKIIPNKETKWIHGGSQRVYEGNWIDGDTGGQSASIPEEKICQGIMQSN